MKYIIAAMFVLMICACTTTVHETAIPEPLETPRPEPSQEQSQPAIETNEMPAPKNNIIQITYGGFDPEYAFFNETNTVIWQNDDNRQHMISCYYYGGGRAFLGEKLNNGDTTKYTFKEHGTYICLDTIYGLRGTVVIYKKPAEYLSPLTVAAIGLANTDIPYSWPLLLMVILSLLLVYMYLIKKR
jgi:plastocyanin